MGKMTTQTVLFAGVFLFNCFLLFTSSYYFQFWDSQRVTCSDLFNWTASETLPYPSVLRSLSSPDSIFAFIHLRKCGGSAIRSHLWNDFQAAGLNNDNSILIFPCFTTYCEVTSTLYWMDQIEPNVALPVHVVGHIPLRLVEVVTTVRPDSQLHCLSTLRPPEERFISCLYYRTREMRKARTLSSFTPSTLKTFSQSFRDIHGYGCSNELLRMFGDESDESVLNQLDLHHTERGMQLMETAKRNMEKCVFTVQGRNEENEAIVRHWFPTLPGLVPSLSTAVNVGLRPPEEVSVELINTIYQLTQLETVLYNYGVQLHERQYRYAMNTTEND
eukprot:TRINITY_DN1957_c0_g1_i1.p1 TRINITY_DN1957_c0_g1~~TRINITY_DN1957_c0_g1_i1.p1  ORF type:complete len:331 (-),score=26.62 TRINITY_DN1957_c0_g1_i1:195-1187(-)